MSEEREQDSDTLADKSTGDGLNFWRFAANLGVGLTAVWLLSYVVPATRTIMLDKALAFFIGLMVTLVLWYSARKKIYPRRFWAFLAAAWFVGLLGNLAWGMYEVLSGESLPRVSPVDLFYLARYVLIGLAYWRVLLIPKGQQWASLATTMLLTVAILMAIVFLSAPASRFTAPLVAGLLYPALDAGLAYAAIQAWGREPSGPQRNALGLLALSMLAFGVANTLNCLGQTLGASSLVALTDLFWPVSDILTGAGVTHLVLTAPARNSLPKGSPDRAQERF